MIFILNRKKALFHRQILLAGDFLKGSRFSHTSMLERARQICYPCIVKCV